MMRIDTPIPLTTRCRRHYWRSGGRGYRMCCDDPNRLRVRCRFGCHRRRCFRRHARSCQHAAATGRLLLPIRAADSGLASSCGTPNLLVSSAAAIKCAMHFHAYRLLQEMRSHPELLTRAAA
jgi:hypothetical protein